MSWIRRLTTTLRPRRLDAALDDELRFHIEQRTEDFLAQGMTLEQARREASLLFGNRTLLRESARDRDVLVWLQTTLQDLRYALRTLRRNPGFAAAAVLSLALGIGANTAIFTLLDQVLLRNLPVAHPEGLVQLEPEGAIYGTNIGSDSLSYPMYRDLRDRNQVFSGLIGRFRVPLSVAFGDRTERVEGELVTGNYFQVLGVGAALGRTFTPQDDITPGGHPLAVLSYGYWIDRFLGDPEALGRRIIVDGRALTIVGVSQKGFDGIAPGHSAKIRIPIAMKAQMTQGYFSEFFNLENRRAYWVETVGRLKPGVSLQRAKASLQPLYHSVLAMEVLEKGFEKASASDRAEFLKSALALLPGSRGNSSLREDYEEPLRILMAIVGLVLLIACANVANLLLARAAARQREIAVRLAIGASAGRITRQSLVESLLLALGGGAAGLLLATWTDRLLLRFIPTDFGPPNLITTPDTRILAFTLAVCVMTGLLFGLVPALATRKVDLAPALKVDARAAAGGRTRFRRALVVAQISLSALLLIAASQFLRSLANLHRVDLGMRGSRSVVAFSINPSLNGHSKEQSVQFYRALLEKLRSSAGIESVGAATIPVLNEDWWSASITLDDAGPQPDNNNPNANLISSGFLSALGIPLLAGRDFAPSDAAAKHRVALVNQAFARQFFGGRNPVGHWIGLDNTPGTKTDIEVVGLAKDSKFYNVRRDIRPQIYLDDDQNPDIQQIIVYLRTAMSASAASTLVRTVMRGLDPHVPVFALRTLDEQAELTLARENMIASLTSAFGLVAIVLAAIGIFGLMSFTVSRRTREIAVRMALGARGGNVRWLVMREVLALAGLGLAVALPAAFGLARLVQSQLYGVKPNDAASIWLAVAALSVVAMLAAYLPVRRAAAIDPMQALRAE